MGHPEFWWFSRESEFVVGCGRCSIVDGGVAFLDRVDWFSVGDFVLSGWNGWDWSAGGIGLRGAL